MCSFLAKRPGGGKSVSSRGAFADTCLHTRLIAFDNQSRHVRLEKELVEDGLSGSAVGIPIRGSLPVGKYAPGDTRGSEAAGLETKRTSSSGRGPSDRLEASGLMRAHVADAEWARHQGGKGAAEEGIRNSHDGRRGYLRKYVGGLHVGKAAVERRDWCISKKIWEIRSCGRPDDLLLKVLLLVTAESRSALRLRRGLRGTSAV